MSKMTCKTCGLVYASPTDDGKPYMHRCLEADMNVISAAVAEVKKLDPNTDDQTILDKVMAIFKTQKGGQ